MFFYISFNLLWIFKDGVSELYWWQLFVITLGQATTTTYNIRTPKIKNGVLTEYLAVMGQATIIWPPNGCQIVATVVACVQLRYYLLLRHHDPLSGFPKSTRRSNSVFFTDSVCLEKRKYFLFFLFKHVHKAGSSLR